MPPPPSPCKLTISLYLFTRWHLFRRVGYLRHQQQVDLLTVKVVSVPIIVFIDLSVVELGTDVHDRQTDVFFRIHCGLILGVQKDLKSDHGVSGSGTGTANCRLVGVQQTCIKSSYVQVHIKSKSTSFKCKSQVQQFKVQVQVLNCSMYQ